MGTNLKFVKVNSIDCVPRYLFEQAKPLDFDIDRLYSWAPVLLNSPMNLIGQFLDKESNIKGVMIVSYNPIPNKLHVHCVSVDKEYHNKGIMKEIKGILNKLKKNVNASEIIGMTTRARALRKLTGATESKLKIMEL